MVFFHLVAILTPFLAFDFITLQCEAMKHIAIIALIALLAVSGHVALAQDCTDGECTSTVAVEQRFTTPNCTGESTVRVAVNYTQSCELEVNNNYNVTFNRRCSSSAGYTEATNWRTNSCAHTPNGFIQGFAVGVCIATGASSSNILWCNQASISSKFKSVKLATEEPTFGRSTACNVTTGCTNGTGTVRAYSSSNCAAVNVTEAAPPSFFIDGLLLPDTCYKGSFTKKRSIPGSLFGFERDSTFATEIDESDRNYYATCRNGFYTITLSTGGCGSGSNKISSMVMPTDTCIPYSDFWVKISCPSAASNLVAGPLVLFLLAVIALVI